MAKVYSNAAITLAAVSSKNCHDGLYRRETSEFHAHELSLRVSPNDNMCWLNQGTEITQSMSSSRVMAQIRTTEWYDKGMYLSRLQELPPLASRAWFFQEWQLSPRILHFDFGQLVWQCSCGYLTQWHATIGQSFVPPRISPIHLDSQDTRSSARTTGLRKIAVFFRVLNPVGLRWEAFESTLMSDWQNTVERYSQLDLSFHRDKLAAISGIVKNTKMFQRGNTYTAGLWQEFMPWDLAWSSTDGILPRPKDFAGPSWSWASLQHNVLFQYRSESGYASRDLRSNCVIHDVQCVPAGDDPTGALKSARLTISGRASHAQLSYDDISPESYQSSAQYRLFKYNALQKGRKELHGFTPDYDLREPGRDYIASNTSLQCLWIFSIKPGILREAFEVGLVLCKSRHVANAYERIGIVEAEKTVAAKWAKWAKSTFIIV